MQAFFRTFLSVTFAAVCTFANATAAVAQEGNDVSVEARGLRIVEKGYGENMSGVRPFNWYPGTTVALLLHRPAGNIIEVDLDASTLDHFTDDRGTNLLQKAEKSWGRTGFDLYADLSEDGKAAMIEVAGGTVPARGAKSLQAAGTLKLVTARGSKNVKVGEVAFAADESFKVGDVTFTVKSAKPSDWQDDVYEVTFRTTDNVDAIAELTFERDGQAIESQRNMTSTMGMGDNVTTQWTYLFDNKLESANVAADVWVGLETHDVPFDIDVGLGLSAGGEDEDEGESEGEGEGEGEAAN